MAEEQERVIILPLENEKYDDYIQRILSNRENKKDEFFYQENHHIIPKKVGGSNKKENLIYLYPIEHYNAHKLLALENPDNQKLTSAWWIMSHIKGENGKRDIEVSAEDYDLSRQLFIENMSGEKSSWYGRKHTEETKKKISESRKGKYTGENSPNYGKHPSEETLKKQSEAHKGYSPTEETRKKISENSKRNWQSSEYRQKQKDHKPDNSGEKNPMYGKHLSDETKKKISEGNKGKHNGPFTEEHRKHLSEAMTGKPGHPCSDETKQKISQANSGKKRTEEQKKAQSERIKADPELRNRLVDYWKDKDRSGENNPRYGKRLDDCPTSIPIICLNNLKIYSCAKEAGEDIGVAGTNITAALKGRQQSAGKDKEGNKLYWMYYSEYLVKQKEEEENSGGETDI